MLPDGPLKATVGGTVMFTTTLTPPEKLRTIGWTFGNRNIMIFNHENTTAPEYEGRITLFTSSGSLELRNLTPNDSGEYRVIIFPETGPRMDGCTRLEVYGEQILHMLYHFKC